MESQNSILKSLVHYHLPDSISMWPSTNTLYTNGSRPHWLLLYLCSNLFESPSGQRFQLSTGLHLPEACLHQKRVLQVSQTPSLWMGHGSIVPLHILLRMVIHLSPGRRLDSRTYKSKVSFHWRNKRRSVWYTSASALPSTNSCRSKYLW